MKKTFGARRWLVMSSLHEYCTTHT
jgi:hypothetical protein